MTAEVIVPSRERPPGLEVVDDVIAMAQDLQRAAVDMPGIDQREAALAALQVLGPDAPFYGTRHLAMHTTSAFIFDRGLTVEESLFSLMEFEEMMVKGWLGDIVYFGIPGVISSLCADIYEPTILEPASEQITPGGALRAPLLVPVCSIEFAVPIR